MEAIILAGGLGTRLRSVVSDVPKPMAPVNGKPFLEWLMSSWINKGVSNFILSVGYKYDSIIDHFGSNFKGREVVYAVEERPLGTGGGLLQAVRLLRGNSLFLLVNGDTYFDIDLKRLLKFHHKKDAKFTMALFKTFDRDRYHSVDLDSEARIRSFKYTGNPNFGGLANGGVAISSAESFEQFDVEKNKKVSLENEILTDMLKSYNHGVYGLLDDGVFIDIGLPSDYERAEAVIASNSLGLNSKQT